MSDQTTKIDLIKFPDAIQRVSFGHGKRAFDDDYLIVDGDDFRFNAKVTHILTLYQKLQTARNSEQSIADFIADNTNILGGFDFFSPPTE